MSPGNAVSSSARAGVLMLPTKRVVVTGFGAVTPIGVGAEDTWQAALRGQSGVSRIVAFDPTDFASQIAAQVLGWNPELQLGSKLARRTDRFTQFALVAAREAVEHSEIQITDENRGSIGAYVGSGVGGLIFLETQTNVLRDRGPSRVSPFLIPEIISDIAAGMISIEHGLHGPNLAIVSACASGAHAIGEAAEVIKRGDAVAMVAGGSEAAITPIGLAGFCAGRALSTRNDDPEHASRPFDFERDGFVAGGGAGALILESAEHAEERGATIHAEIVGYGASADAFHITQPPKDGAGARRAMENAMRKARLNPEDIDYVNAHGTSTQQGDVSETNAIKEAFGGAMVETPISSTKSMTGHLIGAAGAVELVFCIQAIRDSVIPPTTNYETPDPECDLDYVPNESRELDLHYVMSNSFGFGGHNASLIVGSP